ncbi:MAG: cellobiose phosphorylase [Lachnospiraceae bacterium]|nr:cellobiose phosphorylase [Lachnospiraceae bacterium]
MSRLKYLDTKGTFELINPDLTSYLYFPLANEAGMMSCITPDLGGDIKLDQNTFLLEPVSVENLHNNKSTRNFWVYVEGKGAWSATGRSSKQQAKLFDEDKEDVKLTAGVMWHSVERISKEMGLKSVVTSFVPATEDKVELTKFEITNTTDADVTITPTMAVPMYARSATNLRDHRHVTSLLHRTYTVKDGVVIFPTLTFDERGHNKNTIYYGAFAKADDNGMQNPISFCPVTEEFIGEGGNFENPYYVMKNLDLPYGVGDEVDGYETVAAMRFATTTLKAGQTKTFLLALGYGQSAEEVTALSDKYLDTKIFDADIEKTKEEWQEKINLRYSSKDTDFDNWMHWVNFQPMLRRIYGCSFLPAHDYGKGGRGWRDLWQDCLALLIMNPSNVRSMLISNYGGVRFDGTNATIIGSKQGEFIADRNNITRVWMDHGAWPYLTTELYIKQSGDVEFLTEENTYFKDPQVCRGEEKDWDWNDEQGNKQLTADGSVYSGTILEHMLMQHLTSFYDVGEHNHIRLRGADWNDAIDMADKRGESVAFTALYGGNLGDMSDLIKVYGERTGKQSVVLAKELLTLLEVDASVYDDIEKKKAILDTYCKAVKHQISGEKVEFEIAKLCDTLKGMSEWVKEHIRNTEWISSKDGYSWFNGYYDNSGRRVEGDCDINADKTAASLLPKRENEARMMLTGQVFTIMSGTATKEQVADIAKAADNYLYDEKIGGYRLNNDFNEIKTDMGRLFGFAFGHKENGAVFCHMATMYANSLYKRGFAKEGYKVINTLFRHCHDFETSNIFPGVPEYVSERGRGMYHYLTGAASWMLLTVLNEMYGAKGEYGALVLEPKLLAEQFANGEASVEFMFRDNKLNITYVNEKNLEAGEYSVKEIYVDGTKYDGNVVAADVIEGLDKNVAHEIKAILV